MNLEVMLDLETMSLNSYAAVVSIGAVKFDPYGKIGELGDPSNPEYAHFHQAVALDSLTDAGYMIDGSTIAWWLSDNVTAEARAALLNDAVDIATALSRFFIWFGPTSVPTWGNGAGFDNVILRNAYQRMGGETPFKYSHDRCHRTMSALFPDIPYVRPTVPHNALEDAKAQAVHLQKLFNRINFKG